jgi:hypothetical protein
LGEFGFWTEEPAGDSDAITRRIGAFFAYAAPAGGMITKDFHLTKDFRQMRGKSFVIMVMTRSAGGNLRVFVAWRAEFMGDPCGDNAKCRK